MAEGRISFVLLFSFLLATVFGNGSEDVQNSTVDVAKFVRENPKVWVYNTTEPGNVTCRLDEYTNVTATQASIFRSFDNGTRVKKNLIARFFHVGDGSSHAKVKYDAMEINDTKTKLDYPLIEEVFEFQSDSGRCAVVAVLDNSKEITVTWLDLRVSDTSVGNEPAQECKNEFERILSYYPIRKRSRISYSSRCQTNSS